jgi:hypothetical protein
MGGQETLLLTALHPRLLAGASALDSATDMAARYRAFPLIPGGLRLQWLARIEIGGTPASAPVAYAARSPIHYVSQLAASGVSLHIWWSVRDRIVVDQNQESGRLYRAMIRKSGGARHQLRRRLGPQPRDARDSPAPAGACEAQADQARRASPGGREAIGRGGTRRLLMLDCHVEAA